MNYSTRRPTRTIARMSSDSLDSLLYRNEFVDRHIGPDDDEIRDMLAVLGLESLEELVRRTVPAAIAGGKELALASAVPESEALARLKAIAAQNRPARSFIGMGYYDTHLPAQCAGKSGLVHCLYALPTRNFPGPARMSARFPAHDDGPDRDATRERLAAR